MVNLLFYSTKDLVDFSVVFFVVAADYADKRHQYKETATDDRNHNFSFHVMLGVLVVQVVLRHVPTKSILHQPKTNLKQNQRRALIGKVLRVSC